MKRRKTLLNVAHEFLAALPYLFKHRPVQLMFIGIGVIFIPLLILNYYNISQWVSLIPIFIGLGILFLGFIYMTVTEEREEIEGEDTGEEIEEKRYKETMQMFKVIEKELREIKNRLEKIEEHL